MLCALLKARRLRFLQITSRTSCTALRPDQLDWSLLWKWTCKKRECPWRQRRPRAEEHTGRAELVWAEGGAVLQTSSAAVLPWLRHQEKAWAGCPEQPGQQHPGLYHFPQTQGHALNFNKFWSTALRFIRLILLQLHLARKKIPRDQLSCPNYRSLSQYFDKTANGQADREDTQTFPKCRIPSLIQTTEWVSQGGWDVLFQHSHPVTQLQQMFELSKWRKFPLPVPISASSKPCLPCGACPLTQTPAASASTAVQSLSCLKATCGINLSSSTTQQGIHSL